MAVNALSQLAGSLAPQWDLVGPTVEDDLRRLVTRYGALAVKEATKRVTKAKRGPKTRPDWREMRDVTEADARIWLQGGDPISLRSNYAIAKEFAERNPGQSAVSTHQRIERKLGKKIYGRRYHILAAAETLSREDYPWADHLRTLEALVDLPGNRFWEAFLRSARNDISDYTAKWGAPPPNLSIRQIQVGARLSVSGETGASNLVELQSSPLTGLAAILAQAINEPCTK